jgi:hypothetical protein
MRLSEILKEAQTFGVPEFQTSADAQEFIRNLPGSAKVADHVVDPETGEVLMPKGSVKRKEFRQEPSSMKDKDFDKDFEDIYQWVESSVGKITGSENDGDYDLDLIIPYLISRKDGLAMSEDDLDEVEMWLDDNYAWFKRTNMLMQPSINGNRIQIDVGFH